MISKDEFKDIMSVEKSIASRDNMYICYLYLDTIDIIKDRQKKIWYGIKLV